LELGEGKQLAEGAVSKALTAGASYAEARVQNTHARQFILKNGESQPSFFAQGYGIGIRVISRGALGFAATNEMSPKVVNGLAEKAVKLAKASAPVLKRKIAFDSSKPVRRKWSAPENIKVESADAAWLRNILLDIENRIADGRAGVKLPGRFLVLGAELEEKYYVNSDGARVEARLPRIGFFGSLTAMEGGASA